MSWHFTGIKATCEGIAKKGCPHHQSLNLSNPDGMIGALLFNMAERDGWLLPPGGGKVLCKHCLAEAEHKYGVKLKKEIKKKEEKVAERSSVPI